MGDWGGNIMARRGVLLGMFAGGVTASLAGCGVLNSHAAYRFRMTVEAQTGQGIVRGTTISEVRAEKNNFRLLADERAGGSGVFGEALALEMPDGPIFVLMQVPFERESLQRVVTQALKPGTQLGGVVNFFPAVQSLGGWFSGTVKAELSRSDWPVMVRFRDLNDPKSIEQVDPDAIGVKRIMLETTDDDVTTGIEKRFPPWFGSLIKSKARLNGSTSSAKSTNNLADMMGPGSFSTEIRQ